MGVVGETSCHRDSSLTISIYSNASTPRRNSRGHDTNKKPNKTSLNQSVSWPDVLEADKMQQSISSPIFYRNWCLHSIQMIKLTIAPHMLSVLYSKMAARMTVCYILKGIWIVVLQALSDMSEINFLSINKENQGKRCLYLVCNQVAMFLNL